MTMPRRVQLLQLINAVFVCEQARGEGRVQDISREGFFIRSPMLPRDGAPIAVMLEPPSGRKIAVRGIVRWNTATIPSRAETSGFGIQIQSFDNDYGHFVDGALAAGVSWQGDED
jgi:hypothetical protein